MNIQMRCEGALIFQSKTWEKSRVSEKRQQHLMVKKEDNFWQQNFKLLLTKTCAYFWTKLSFNRQKEFFSHHSLLCLNMLIHLENFHSKIHIIVNCGEVGCQTKNHEFYLEFIFWYLTSEVLCSICVCLFVHVNHSKSLRNHRASFKGKLWPRWTLIHV